MSQVRWQELTKSECFGLLAGQHLGRVVLVDDLGRPLFRSTSSWTAIRWCSVPTRGPSWTPRCRGRGSHSRSTGPTRQPAPAGACWSAGEAIEVTDPDELARVRELPLYPWAPGAKTHYVRILPASLTGRRIAVPGDAPSHWCG